jgi:tetratricopeptide (TPR) repeat protein
LSARSLVFVCLVLAVVYSPAQTSDSAHIPEPAYRPADPLNAIAFDHFYNLEYDRSVQEFEQILQRHPNDPFAVNHLITAVLIRELYHMGALNTGEYANDSFIGEAHRPADPKMKQWIKDLVARAENLEEQELKANPNDVYALYARGATRGQFAIYTALVERAWFSALRNAVGARHDHERVLALDPNYTDAKLIVGSHNYVTGSLPWSVKIAVSMVGLSGNKEKGLQYLRDAADANGESSVDAKIVLALFLRREHRYAEALQLMRGLSAGYPRDILFALEEGNLLRAEGKNTEAAAAYQKIWQAGRDGHYAGLHYEVAALSLGDLRRSEKDYAGASEAYELVNQVKDPDPEVLQKANLGAGQVYDLMRQRDLAIKSYRAVLAVNANSIQAEMAKKCMKDPCRE